MLLRWLQAGRGAALLERLLRAQPAPAQLPTASFYELLMSELDAVGWSALLDLSPSLDELSLEPDFGETEVPPYLQDEVVEPSPAVPAEPAAATGEQVDEFGLPVATPAGA